MRALLVMALLATPPLRILDEGVRIKSSRNIKIGPGVTCTYDARTGGAICECTTAEEREYQEYMGVIRGIDAKIRALNHMICGQDECP